MNMRVVEARRDDMARRLLLVAGLSPPYCFTLLVLFLSLFYFIIWHYFFLGLLPAPDAPGAPTIVSKS